MSRPSTGGTPAPPSHDTQRIDYDGSNNPIYVGWAAPTAGGVAPSTASAVWRIQRITWSGANATTIEWADGNLNYDNIWDNRAALAYA